MLTIVVDQVTEITEALTCTIRLINDKNPYRLELKALKASILRCTTEAPLT